MQPERMVHSVTANGANWNPEIGLRHLDGDAELMGEVVNLLINTLQARSPDLAVAVEQGQHQHLRQHTHAMLASLKVLGFDDEARVFESYETAAVMDDIPVCQRLGPQVLLIWNGIIETLVRFSQRVPA